MQPNIFRKLTRRDFPCCVSTPTFPGRDRNPTRRYCGSRRYFYFRHLWLMNWPNTFSEAKHRHAPVPINWLIVGRLRKGGNSSSHRHRQSVIVAIVRTGKQRRNRILELNSSSSALHLQPTCDSWRKRGGKSPGKLDLLILRFLMLWFEYSIDLRRAPKMFKLCGNRSYNQPFGVLVN